MAAMEARGARGGLQNESPLLLLTRNDVVDRIVYISGPLGPVPLGTVPWSHGPGLMVPRVQSHGPTGPGTWAQGPSELIKKTPCTRFWSYTAFSVIHVTV